MRLVLLLLLWFVVSVARGQPPGNAGDFLAALDAGDLKSAEQIMEKLPEPDRRCATGLYYAKIGDVARVYAMLQSCEGAADALQPKIASALGALSPRLSSNRYAPITLSIEPDSARFEVSLWPGVELPNMERLWLPKGSHTIRASADGHQSAETVVRVGGPSRQTVILQLPPAEEPIDSSGDTVDFSDETAAETPTAGSLEKVEHGSMLPDRYAKRRSVKPSREQQVLSPWDVRLGATLGPSSWSEGDDSVFGYRFAGGAARRFGVLGAEAGLAVSRTGGKVAGDSELSTYVGLELLGRARASSGGWGGSIAAGGFVRLPFADQVLGRDLSSAIVGVAGEVTFARQLTTSTWLELTARTDLGLSEAADELGRAGLISAGLSLVWTLPGRTELAPLPTD